MILTIYYTHILSICIVEFGSESENGSLETRIRFYLEGVFMPGVGVIGIFGRYCND